MGYCCNACQVQNIAATSLWATVANIESQASQQQSLPFCLAVANIKTTLTLNFDSCICHRSPVLFVEGSSATSKYLLPSARIKHNDMDVAWRENTCGTPPTYKQQAHVAAYALNN